MNLISGRNAHELLPILADRMLRLGKLRESRNGKVLKLDGPTLVCYERPLERVVFWPERDANPFFHLMESLWMLAGRNDVAFLTQYSKQISEYSDDGKTFNGAYGYRWRNHFGYDQFEWIIDELSNSPDSRRCVLQMWDAGDYDGADLERSDLRKAAEGGKDCPCNTQAYFAINDGALDITVCNRSNDLVWGMLGANCVHFSILLEYVAYKIGVPVGKYYQFTNNLHMYERHWEQLRPLVWKQGFITPYGEYPGRDALKARPMIADSNFESDLADLDSGGPFRSDYFQNVVRPMKIAHKRYKEGELDNALGWCGHIEADDWRKACSEWIQRRIEKRRKAYADDNGVIYEA